MENNNMVNEPAASAVQPKKKGKKGKIIGIIIAVIAVIIIGSAIFGGSDEPEKKEPAKNSALAFYTNLSKVLKEGDDYAFSVNEKAEKFLNENDSLFVTDNEDKAKKYTDNEITWAKIEKNSDRYGDKLMHISYAEVVQVFETELEKDEYGTELNIIDENGLQYYVIYLGELPEVEAGSAVNVYGLPLSMSSFKNINGGTTLCPIIAGSFVEKLN